MTGGLEASSGASLGVSTSCVGEDPVVADYETAMAIGAQRYGDVISALTSAGVPARFTQTGGMCAALEAALDGGSTLLITDADGPLPWDPERRRGWTVGLYPQSTEDQSEPLACRTTAGEGVEDLLALIDAVLRTPVADGTNVDDPLDRRASRERQGPAGRYPRENPSQPNVPAPRLPSAHPTQSLPGAAGTASAR